MASFCPGEEEGREVKTSGLPGLPAEARGPAPLSLGAALAASLNPCAAPKAEGYHDPVFMAEDTGSKALS